MIKRLKQVIRKHYLLIGAISMAWAMYESTKVSRVSLYLPLSPFVWTLSLLFELFVTGTLVWACVWVGLNGLGYSQINIIKGKFKVLVLAGLVTILPHLLFTFIPLDWWKGSISDLRNTGLFTWQALVVYLFPLLILTPYTIKYALKENFKMVLRTSPFIVGMVLIRLFYSKLTFGYLLKNHLYFGSYDSFHRLAMVFTFGKTLLGVVFYVAATCLMIKLMEEAYPEDMKACREELAS